MSLFNKKKKEDDNSDVYIPQVVSEDYYDIQPTETQLMQQRLDIEQSRLNNQRDAMQCVSGAINMVGHVADIVAECKQMHEHSEQLRMMTDVQLANIAAKYENTKEYMNKSFGERNKALGKHYTVLDRAMQTNDRELIIEAMRGISGIVSTSPIQDIEKFRTLYNDTSKPLLDF